MRLPSVPTEDAFGTLFRWLEEVYPGWGLVRLTARTARRHYMDQQRAFDGAEVFRTMAGAAVGF